MQLAWAGVRFTHVFRQGRFPLTLRQRRLPSLWQVQKPHLPFKPPSSEHRVHLRERSAVRHPAVHPLSHQQDAVAPPQRDHPGGRQQQ